MREDTNDWMIDENGFYVATRSFLIRRGSCCANQCRNCPYIPRHGGLESVPPTEPSEAREPRASMESR